MKVAWESRKIMDAPDLKVSCTCVRIPTLRAHSESITLETELPITANEVGYMHAYRCILRMQMRIHVTYTI